MALGALACQASSPRSDVNTPEADREVANTLADLIIGGPLVTGVDDQADERNRVDET